jgi:SAM-dependent methyltransferase
MRNSVNLPHQMLFKVKNKFVKHISPESPLYKTAKPIYLNIKHLWYSVARTSIFADESKLRYCSLYPARVLAAALEIFKPGSVLDVGCGTGKALEFFIENGVDAVGIEGSRIAINASNHSSKIIEANLKHELNLHRRFDLVWCFEVAEHLHPAYADNLVRTLSNHGDTLLLSAARPGQGGEGHFNEQPAEYWIAKCNLCGFDLDREATAILQGIPDEFSENILIFKRKGSFA